MLATAACATHTQVGNLRVSVGIIGDTQHQTQTRATECAHGTEVHGTKVSPRGKHAMCTCTVWPEPIFNIFSGHADGEREGLHRIGGQHRKGLGETRL